MTPALSAPQKQPLLRFDPSLPPKELKKIVANLSAIVLEADSLWLGGDEGTSIDRLSRDTDGNFSRHTRFNLAPLLDLPDQGSKPSEIDIEGLDVDGGYLWVVGSHSLKRDKPDPDKPLKENLERLETVETDGNRFTLGRVPLDNNSSKPVASQGALTAARLDGNRKGNLLTEALAGDPHIGPACLIPSKDNGLDIEGLAVRGNRVLAGLRGPVLRGWAVVLDLDVRDASPGKLKLERKPRKHFLQLEGLGVRDLAIHGKDLYILAGPTMDLDGPVFVFRWQKALDASDTALVPRDGVEKLLAVPFGTGKQRGTDHAEGLALIDGPGPAPSAMICYDSPAESRLDPAAKNITRADIFELAGSDIDA